MSQTAYTNHKVHTQVKTALTLSISDWHVTKLRSLTEQFTHPWSMTDKATNGITPTPTRRSLMAKFMISTDATEWKDLVATTMTMTRMLPTEKRTKRIVKKPHSSKKIKYKTKDCRVMSPCNGMEWNNSNKMKSQFIHSLNYDLFWMTLVCKWEKVAKIKVIRNFTSDLRPILWVLLIKCCSSDWTTKQSKSWACWACNFVTFATKGMDHFQ